MKSELVTFGEIMTRFSPQENLKLEQAMPGKLEVIFAGAEASVAVSYSRLGGKSHFVTALPKNAMSDACIMDLKRHSVGLDGILRVDQGRLGTYYLETGANQRASRVEYDRSKSSVSLTEASKYDWQNIFNNKTWFHITGITPALSKEACKTTKVAVQAAKEQNLTVSCDLNFRGKLWKWNKNYSPRELAKKEMTEILKFVDIIIGNEQDADNVLGIQIKDADFDKGSIDISQYSDIAKMISEEFSNLSYVAITLRESISANHNRWGAMLYDSKNQAAYFSPEKAGQYSPYEITHIVDRLGAGDSFAAALIFSLSEYEFRPKDALNFSVAASCISHSIKGDFNITSADEVKRLAGGFTSGRVVR